MRWIKWIGVGLVVLVVAGAAGLYLSAQQALDHDFGHTRATEQLPAFTGVDSGDGLVRIETERGTFRARVSGMANAGPAVVLLHGFPESSAMWRPLVEAAAAAGFRVVAFDQRGYSPGARPAEVEEYALPELLDDVPAVTSAVGFDTFHLVGHDWGSIVGWNLAAADPERVLSWASLSIPHPAAAALANAADTDGPPAYVRFFQTSGVAETVFLSRGMALMRNGLYSEMPPDQLGEYVALFSEPGALTAAFNWYRALPSSFGSSSLMAGEVSQPVLYVWGERDMQIFVHPRVREIQKRFVRGPYEELSLDAGHWLIQEEPEAVTGAVMKHLESQRR